MSYKPFQIHYVFAVASPGSHWFLQYKEQASNDPREKIIHIHLLTYLLYVAESFLRIWLVLSWSTNSPHCMEPRRFVTPFTSALHLSLSDRSSSFLHIAIPEDPSSYFPPIYSRVFQVISFPRVSRPKPCIQLSSPHTCYMPCPSHASRFNNPKNI